VKNLIWFLIIIVFVLIGWYLLKKTANQAPQNQLPESMGSISVAPTVSASVFPPAT